MKAIMPLSLSMVGFLAGILPTPSKGDVLYVTSPKKEGLLLIKRNIGAYGNALQTSYFSLLT